MHKLDNAAIIVGDIGFPNFSLIVSVIYSIVTMISRKYNSRDCLDNVESMKKINWICKKSKSKHCFMFAFLQCELEQKSNIIYQCVGWSCAHSWTVLLFLSTGPLLTNAKYSHNR